MSERDTDHRPDPDALLEQVQADEQRAARGRLKVFLGSAPGVGKTYAMLETARRLSGEGRDVVVGWIETHGRMETAELLLGFEILPPLRLPQGGHMLTEFNLDAALARRPAVLLVDELPHTNAAGTRHPKRWQDIEELVAAGIEVWTTLNVQHLESLNDYVEQITGVRVRETVPDAVLGKADEVELIDLPPDELLARLDEGRIYPRATAEKAKLNFFRRGNLLALREMALRSTAEHVDADVADWRRQHAVDRTWPVHERVLVGAGPSPFAARLVRAAARMADRLRAELHVVTVETPDSDTLPPEARARLQRTLTMAEQFGARVAHRSGTSISGELLAYAREHNVTRIVVGKPLPRGWRDWFGRSLLDDLVRDSGDLDIHVIHGVAETPAETPPAVARRRAPASGYWLAVVVPALATGLSWALFPFVAVIELVLFYLVAVVIVATRSGRGPAILASVLSVMAFDVFFIPPYYTLIVYDHNYWVTFLVMLAISLLISGLTDRVRTQALIARRQQLRTERLLDLTAGLTAAPAVDELTRIVASAAQRLLDRPCVVLLPDADQQLQPSAFAGITPPGWQRVAAAEMPHADWAWRKGIPVGHQTDTMPGARGLYLPMRTATHTVGVAAVLVRTDADDTTTSALLSPEQRQLAESFVSQAAVAIERSQLGIEAEAARLQTRTEVMRNSLLSAISHDLRTPLASITGAASTLLDRSITLTPDRATGLATAIRDEASRLSRLVTNLLEVTRLDSDQVRLNRQPAPVDEVVGTALVRAERVLGDTTVRVDVPADLPLIDVDEVLVEQVLLNLIENAARYAPGPLEISARRADAAVEIEVADHGPGLPPGDTRDLFRRFTRGPAPPGAAASGAGLGLALCDAVMRAHGGTITGANRDDGPGAHFVLRFPEAAVAPPAANE